MPRRIADDAGGVVMRPASTRKRFWPAPSVTRPSPSSRMASAKPLALASDLAHRHQGIRADTAPRGNADVDAGFDGVAAEVGTPREGEDADLDRRRRRHEAHGAGVAVGERADVAGVETVAVHDFAAGFYDFFRRVGQRHAQKAARALKARDVLTQPENLGSVGGGVAAHAFVDRGTVVHGVRRDVHSRFVEVAPTSAMPDPIRFFDQGPISCFFRRVGCLSVEKRATKKPPEIRGLLAVALFVSYVRVKWPPLRWCEEEGG